MIDIKKINCPTCSKGGTWCKDNLYKPFCSARCKLIDLGEWAAESHTIHGESIASDLLLATSSVSEE